MNERQTNLTAAIVTNDRDWRSHVQTLVVMAGIASGIHLCFRLAWPILAVIVWALALAVVFTPIQQWIASQAGRPKLAAVQTVKVLGLVVLGLAALLGQPRIAEALKGTKP